ncbi:MAG: hypothetical protein QG550_94 [Pseudomonadota bacterium]|nr:hypothetical protein [Pseudomonadota bacterium]
MARFQRTDIELLFPDGQAATRAQLEHDPRWLEVHAGQRPLCRCTPAGVEMLVRHRQGRHFLANLPGRSHHHSLGCPSYAPDPLIDPRRHYSAAALARSGEICHVVVAADPLGSPPFAHFTPQAALELLWDSANLTLWSPRMRGRRSYTAVRAALLGAAERTSVNHAPVAASLYFPDGAHPKPGTHHHFVAGLVLRIVHSPHSVGFDIAHDRSGDLFWLSRRDWSDQLQALFGSPESPVLPDPREREVWMLSRIVCSASARPQLQSPGFLAVTPGDRLPADDSAQAAMLRWLVDQGRRFRRCPVLDARTDPAIPFVALLDTPQPTYVFSADPARVPPFRPLPQHPPSTPLAQSARAASGALALRRAP